MISKEKLEEWIILNGDAQFHDVENDINFYSEKEVIHLIMKLLKELNNK